MNRVAICVLLWHYMNPMIYNIIVTPSWDAEILHYLLLLCVYYEITLLLLIIIIIVFYYYYYLLCSFFFFTISLLGEKVAVGATIFHYAQCYRSLSLLSPSMVSCNGRSQQAGIRQCPHTSTAKHFKTNATQKSNLKHCLLDSTGIYSRL